MGIMIKNIRIINFRSLKQIDIELNKDTTILVGKNNSGKSNIMQAMWLAFNFTTILKEDIFISPDEPFSEAKKITIDVKILPIDNDGNIKDEFNDRWSRALGSSISIDDVTDKNYFAFRTEIAYATDKEIYTNTKYKIDNWSETGASKVGDVIGRETLESIDNLLVTAQRDISLDIRDKRSIFGKLISKIKVADDVRGKIESQLERLNKNIVNESEILQSISKELAVTTTDQEGKVHISPVTRDIESLYRGMNIHYTNKFSSPIAVENLGLGIRSWAVFSTIKAEIKTRINKSNTDDNDTAYHPFVLIEEPEAHMHPQAQRQLLADINGIQGQKVITTHSPYILSQIELDKIRYVRKEGANSVVSSLFVDELSAEDLRKIRRTVMNTRGEILYANAVVLVEGETEEQAITVYLREYFKKELFELGINVVGVGGNNYLPFMRMLQRINTRWYVFSDGEAAPLTKLRNCLMDLLGTDTDFASCPNVFILDDGYNLEKYLVEEGYSAEIIKAINKKELECGHEDDYFDYYVKKHSKQKVTKKDLNKRKASTEESREALLNCITKGSAKTKYATVIAEEICKMSNDKRRIPKKIKELFLKIEKDLKEG